MSKIRKILFLLFAIFITNPEEISKVPFFLNHYFEHSSIRRINISDFILLHYFNDQHEKSNEEHHHLPLKHDQHCCSISQSIHYGPVHNPGIIKIIPHEHYFVTLNNTPYSFTVYHNIWNPPKKA